ncbi:homeodomain-like protein [Tanacetum coccineum]
MVSKKRLYYGGLDGFRAPVVPKAPRSIRRVSNKKSSAGSEICPFELLAAVAGKLLQESESSTSSTGQDIKEQVSVSKDSVKKEPLDVKLKPLRLDYLDQGCYAESEFVPEPSDLELKLEPTPLNDLPHSDNDSGIEHASIVTTSDFLKEVGTNVKMESHTGVNGSRSKSEGGSPSHGSVCDINMDTNRADVQTEAVGKLSDDFTAIKTCKLQDKVKPSVLSKSYSSVHLPFYGNPVPSACFPRHRNSVKLGLRDDDENSFSYNHHSTKMKAFRLQSRAGYRRVRKMMTSKYWKSAPKLKDYELSNTTSIGVKHFDDNRKNIYKRERCQVEVGANRRKLFHHSSKLDYVHQASSESIFNLPERSASGDRKRMPAASHKAKAATSSVSSHKSSFQSKDGHVKFSIKSFTVPELYIEMPETSTLGSLKMAVMKAVTKILGGELDVGVLLQGKKVRDENQTLQQTGITFDSDTLGFMLEPNHPEGSSSPVQKEPPLVLPSDRHQPLINCPASPIIDVGSLDDPPVPISLENKYQSTQESKSLLPEALTKEIEAITKALVPMTPVNPEALSVVPMNNKLSKRSELSQRRTRRPFSVTEVEALVEAVENLGTGRWRDVKIRSFDDANHRTYVDLKDKWKTLVHTASISPQQRRGEPVPQDLLDRVLAAHSFWSQNQSKLVGRHQSEPLQTVGTPVKVCLEFER